MKALVGAFNQEKALVGASVIVQPVVEPMDRFTALISTQYSRYLVIAIAAIQPITDKRCYSARARPCRLVRDGVVICLIAAISFLLLIKAWVMLPLIVIQ